MSSACLGQMIIETELDIAPKMKKMKLTSRESPTKTEIIKSNYVISDPKEHLKSVFPFFTDEKIKEIVEKSSNNIESAIKMVHQLREDELKKNRNFVNLHSTDRKRRFTDMINVDNMPKFEIRQNNTNNNNLNNGMIDGPSEPTTERRTLHIVKDRKKSNLTDDDLEKIIYTVNSFGTREESRNYLRSKFSMLLQSEHIVQPAIVEEKKIPSTVNKEELKKQKKSWKI